MANQFQTISSGLAELKNYYQGPIVDQFNEDCAIYRGSEKIKQGWSGQQVIRPLRVRKNQGVGAAADNGNLPAIGRQTTVQAIIAAKYNYLRFGVTGPMIKASQSDTGSFVRSAAYELEMGYKDLMSEANRQFSFDGTGKIATINTNANASTSLIIGGREAGSFSSTEPALKFVDVGTIFDITDGTNIIASGVTVNSISSGTPTSATATLVLSQAVTCTTAQYLIRSGSLGNEIQGLLYTLDAGTSVVFNVDRSQYISYQGNVNDLGGAALSLTQIQFPYNEGMRRGGAKYSAMYSDFDSLRYYQKLLTADKRYMNTVKGDGGFANKDKFFMDFNGLPWVPDKDCPTRIFILPEDVLKSYVLAEMEFADETGSMYIAQSDVDSFEVRVRFFTNLFNEQPAACGVVRNYISP